MIDRDEFTRALTGSWRLILGDERAMAWFDTSIGGFWRSFAAMILCLPVPLLDLSAQRLLPMADRVGPAAMEGPLYWLVGLVAYGLTWIVFPIALVLLARPLGIARVFVPYMVARNWTTLLAAVPGFVVTLAWYFGLLPLEALGPLNLVALGFALYCSWQATRIACAAPAGLTGGLVALDFLLSLVVYTAADRLIGL